MASQFPYERWAHDQDNPGSMCARFTWDVSVRDYREDSGQATTEVELWRYSFRRLRWDQHWEITLGCYSRRRQWETTVGAAVFGNWEVCTRNATMGNYDGKQRWEARNVCIADFRAGRIHLWCYNGKLRWKLQWETVIQLGKKRRTWRRHILSVNFNSIDDFQTSRRIRATTSFPRI